jgi:hypothetical protein
VLVGCREQRRQLLDELPVPPVLALEALQLGDDGEGLARSSA